MLNRNFKRCLITGSTGSGGSYLCEYILKKDKKIKIHGTYRSKGFLNLLKKKYKKKINVYFKSSVRNINTVNSTNKIKTVKSNENSKYILKKYFLKFIK